MIPTGDLPILVIPVPMTVFFYRNNTFFEFNSDPYEELWQTQDVDANKCDNTCDALAACACGLVYGDYKCACPKGYAGSGVVGDCTGK